MNDEITFRLLTYREVLIFQNAKLENQYWCCIEEANLQGRGQGSR
jgi:hypothetical protein